MTISHSSLVKPELQIKKFTELQKERRQGKNETPPKK